MLGWLYRVLVGSFKSCEHKYKIVSQFKITDYCGNTTAHRYVQQCEHCGKLKNFRTA